MKIAINTETRGIVTWAGEPVSVLAMTRRDKFPVEIKFISGASYVALPEGAEVKLSLNAAGDFGSESAADISGGEVSGVGRGAVYTFLLNLDVARLDALFAGEPAVVDMVLEVQWSHGSTRLTAVPVAVAVSNDYIRDEDPLPTESAG
jgi:hypothetical protein